MLIEFDNGMDLDTNDGNVILFVKNYLIQSLVMEPIVKKLSEEFDNVCFIIISADDVSSLDEDYNIHSAPSILFINNGTLLNCIQGIIPENILRSKINKTFN